MRKYFRGLCGIVFGLSGFGFVGDATARDYDKQASEASGAQLDAVTVFIDADWGGREDGAAREITRAHKAFAQRGYRLISVETYTENGDLEGFL